MGCFPFFICVNLVHECLVVVTFEFGSVGDAGKVFDVSLHAGCGVGEGGFVKV